MILSSRPLRFLVIVVGGWTGIRATMLLPWAGIMPVIGRAVAPPAVAEAARLPADAPPGRLFRSTRTTASGVVPHPAEPSREPAARPDRVPSRPAVPPAPQARAAASLDPPPLVTVAGLAASPTGGSRWSASVWTILRPGGRATPFATQLGGSQAGMRIAYLLDRRRRIALYARASTAIDVAEREAAIGVEWRPTRLPVRIVAERRIGVTGIADGTAVGLVGGVAPTPIAKRVRIEAYGQAGVIARDDREAFADGAVRVTTPLAPRVDVGLGAWGAVQRDAGRLDAGPTIGVVLPIDRHAIRIAFDWRQRLAGDARPASGPALSIGTDF